MLYYVTLTDNNREIPFVLLAKLKVGDRVSYFNFKTLLGNDKVIPELANYGERILVDSVQEENAHGLTLVYPVVNESTSGGTLKTNTLYQFFNANRDFTDFKTISSKLNNPDFGEEDCRQYKKAFDMLLKYQSGEDLFKIVVPQIFYTDPARTSEIIREYNGRSGHKFQHINSEINKTNFMTSEHDQFFIEVPDYDKLKSPDIPLESLVPNPSDVAEPYPHPIYRTPYIQELVGVSPKAARDILRIASNDVKMTPEQTEDFPRIDMRRVYGFQENNDMGILPNEEEFFLALSEYIRYDISQTYPNGDVEALYKSCTCSPKMMEYLQYLLDLATSMNWTHTNKFPIAYAEDPDEDDVDDDSGDEAESAMYLNLDGKIVDGALILTKFIEEASEGVGFDAYIEAIIKLSRWGSAKPSVLKLGNHPLYLDLNSFYLRNTTGNLSSLQPELVDGYELNFNGFIVFDDKYRDIDYRNKVGVSTPKITIPVGLICEKRYQGGVSQTVYMSFFDVISKYKEDPNFKFIRGISFDGSTFQTNVGEEQSSNTETLRLSQDRVSSDIDKLFVNFTSKGLKEVVLHTGSENISNISVLNEVLSSSNFLSVRYEEVKVSSKQEMIEKMKMYPASPEFYVQVNLGNTLTPIVLKASERYDQVFSGKYDLSEILNLYLSEMNNQGFIVEGQFLDEIVPKENKTGSVMDNSANKLEKMMHFGTQTTATVATNDSSKDIGQQQTNKPQADSESVLLVPISQDEDMQGLMLDGRMVGVLVVRVINDKRHYILGDTSLITDKVRPSGNSIFGIMALVMDCVLWTVSGTPERSQVRFHNRETISYYRTLFNEINKKQARK